MVDDLAHDEPELASQIVFGARSVLAVEGTLAARLLHAWARGQSSLLST
jgi:hypothetical protein